MTTRLHVTTVITRFQAGAGTVALRGALGLDPARFRVSIIAGSGDRLLDEAANAGFAVRLVPALRSPIAPRDELRALHQITALLQETDVDVVHTHSAKAGAIGRLAARRAAIARIVHTYHGFPFHEFQSAPRRAAFVEVERRLGRFTDIGLCVGAGVAAEAVRRRLIAPERVRTIGVAVDSTAPACTPAGRAAARATLGISPDALVVGSVGRLAYQKAPEDFVAALATLGRPDVVGVWIGDGELAEKMRRAVDRMAPKARVILAGERADVPALLPALDVFALPSRYEGLPVAIVEAMMCGIPVVATAVNAVSDVVIPGVTGLLVPPERPDLLAGAIRYLLDEPAFAAQMATEARLRLGAQHSNEALGRALTSAYLPSTELTAVPSGSRTQPDIKEPACA
ncbi:MAG TPA: glycosyltransferase [Mycobacteriales bacterium]|nr:glycosyltransferase [Mycobacteriales bacterium]